MSPFYAHQSKCQRLGIAGFQAFSGLGQLMPYAGHLLSDIVEKDLCVFFITKLQYTKKSSYPGT
jgi:hypothetical protein